MAIPENPRLQLSVKEQYPNRYVNNIPGDGNQPFVFDIGYFPSDPAFNLIYTFPEGDQADFPLFSEMRFRPGFGGGAIHTMSNLNHIYTSFEQFNGQVFPKLKPVALPNIPIRQGVVNSIETSDDPSKPKIKITGIRDDEGGEQEYGGNFNNFDQRLNIEIAQNGNVKLTMRDLEHDKIGEIEFFTAENGGLNPIMAQVFGMIAKEIARVGIEKPYEENVPQSSRRLSKSRRNK